MVTTTHDHGGKLVDGGRAAGFKGRLGGQRKVVSSASVVVSVVGTEAPAPGRREAGNTATGPTTTRGMT